jgi:hypothetical protein
MTGRISLVLFRVFVLFSAVSKVAAADFCPRLDAPGQGQQVRVIKSGDVRELLQQLASASPNTTLQLTDGIYRLASNQSLEVNTPGITIRGASRNRTAVIVEGGYNNISINSIDVIVADLTLRNPGFHNIQVRGEKGVVRTKIYNVHLLDAGQQFIKVSTGDGLAGNFADDGLIACSLIEYTTYSRGTGSTPPSYTNGVDILAGKGWLIRDNIFRRIRSQAGPAGPAILVWKNALDTVVRRNVIFDSSRGIALGLSAPDRYSRGGPEVKYDHQHGLVENNVIIALREPADAAIENNYSLNSRIFHNTVYYNPRIKHAVNWSIEYRFPPTTAIIKNNLTNLPIIKRHPSPVQEAIAAGNVTDAAETWFRDVSVVDMRLVATALAIDRGVLLPESQEDGDGTRRPFGRASDAGAFEYEKIHVR